MGYIEKTLGGEEALIAKASFHWLYRVFAYGMLVLSLALTSDRVIVKRRFLARHTDEIQLSAIDEINVDQGLFGRLLGFGRITLQGTGDDDVDIPAIASPLRFRRSIQQALENMRPTAVSKGSSRARF